MTDILSHFARSVVQGLNLIKKFAHHVVCRSSLQVRNSKRVREANRVLGVITGLEPQKSSLKTDLVNMVVTPSQLLCVPVTKLVKADVEQADADARAQKKKKDFLEDIKTR